MNGPQVLGRPLVLGVFLLGALGNVAGIRWATLVMVVVLIVFWPFLTEATRPVKKVSRSAAWRAEDTAVLIALNERGFDGADEDDARYLIEALEMARANIEATP